MFITAYWYLFYDTVPFNTDVTSVRGVVLVNDPNINLSSSVTDGNSLMAKEGFTVTTDDTSQAILSFGDSSLTMYGNTTITLLETQLPRFYISSSPTRITIILKTGRIRTTTARSRDLLNFDVVTPHTKLAFNQGSFSVEVKNDETQITTRLGEATVIGDELIVALNQGSRIVVGADRHLSDPLPAAQNLLGESNFTANFTDTWDIYKNNQTEDVTTIIEDVSVQDRTVVEFHSDDQDNTHTEIGIIKEVNKDVHDFRSLKVSAEVQLIYQSLEGGGYQGTEFPIMLNIAYKDANNNDRNWFHGFYYSVPPENYILTSLPSKSNERIARFIWYPYESENLLTILGPEKPVYIKSIRIYASGWLYQSRVANISLLAEE
jgi:hypothetical protein